MNVRKLKIRLKERVENGAVQFNNDWPGIFIRGDSALYYIQQLRMMKQLQLLKDIKSSNDIVNILVINSIDELISLFSECIIRPNEE